MFCASLCDRATKKAGGTVKNSADSKPKYLGVKKFGGEWCKPGNIIIRQRGQKYRPGEYVGMVEHTLCHLASDAFPPGTRFHDLGSG